jgi:DNA-directed RNA polymerase specialized sigma24 family protein
VVVATPVGWDAIEEISVAADMPVGTAKCYAHRGRSRLRDKLSDVA